MEGLIARQGLEAPASHVEGSHPVRLYDGSRNGRDRRGVPRHAAPHLVRNTSLATWPSPRWRSKVTPRSRCARRCAACGRSNGPCSSGEVSRRLVPQPGLMPMPRPRGRSARGRRTRLCRKPTRPVTRCSTTAPPREASSTTISEVRFNRTARGWLRPRMKFASRSDGIWATKKGRACREAAGPPGRLHRPWT